MDRYGSAINTHYDARPRASDDAPCASYGRVGQVRSVASTAETVSTVGIAYICPHVPQHSEVLAAKQRDRLSHCSSCPP